MKRPLLSIVVLAAVMSASGIGLSARADTALQVLRNAQEPRSRQGHTLLPLTRWGWTMPLEVRVELAKRWGYALEFGGYATGHLLQAVQHRMDRKQ